MQLTPISGETGQLQQLHRWLTIGGSSFLLGGAGLFIPLGLVFVVLIWGAVLFTPYMLWQLYQSRKIGWIVGFAVNQ